MLGNLLHRRVELRARDPEELGEYYGSVWGFDVEESRGVWSVRAGSTELVFAPATDDTDPFYHFAFNIPEHRFVDAKQWLSQRGPLLTDSDWERMTESSQRGTRMGVMCRTRRGTSSS